MWQIGFDFGTCFCKVVCRDMVAERAHVYIPDRPHETELPFLIPSSLCFDGRLLSMPRETGTHYVEGGLYHLKLALEQVALGKYGAEVLRPYREAFRTSTADDLAKRVRVSTVYLLARILGDVRRYIHGRGHSRSSGAADDYFAVNMAIPVADAQSVPVRNAYLGALEIAWMLADSLSGDPGIELADLTRRIEDAADSIDAGVAEQCDVYPEVFANIQVFVRSRASDPGVYLFSDTGAGTVDQCIFHFIREEVRPGITYYPGPLRDDTKYAAMLGWVSTGRTYLRAYSAAVLPLGSARIESLAAGEATEERRPQDLERWRRLKEDNVSHPRLSAARQRVAADLREATLGTIRDAGRNGWTQEALGPIRIVFGGGGHCRVPYADAVEASTPGSRVVGLPPPDDLDLRGEQERWLARLAVAYGLSFHKHELARFTYPDDLPRRFGQIRGQREDMLRERRWRGPRQA